MSVIDTDHFVHRSPAERRQQCIDTRSRGLRLAPFEPDTPFIETYHICRDALADAIRQVFLCTRYEDQRVETQRHWSFQVSSRQADVSQSTCSASAPFGDHSHRDVRRLPSAPAMIHAHSRYLARVEPRKM